MLPIPKLLWHELTAASRPVRRPEPEVMNDLAQVRSYVRAFEWGGPTSALQLHHLRELSRMIRPGDVVLDLACGPGPLLLELASLYPECRFIGADLSPTMLAHLRAETKARGLKNVITLKEDICTLPSLKNTPVDLIICTAALHHLPNEAVLRRVFRRLRSLLRANGGFYLFDYGLLKSARTRELCVKDFARFAPAITARDYDLSLQATFPIPLVVGLAENELPRPFCAHTSRFIDFLYFLQSAPRATPSVRVCDYLRLRRREFTWSLKIEYLLLRLLRKTYAVRGQIERSDSGANAWSFAPSRFE
jgi:SAM-dependent methyltransferase